MSPPGAQEGVGLRVPVKEGPRGAARIFPFLDWVRGYPRGALKSDLYAGAVVALVSLPSALGYAHLAGLPPESGLYAVVFAGVVFTLFSTSRQLGVGPTGLISAVVAVGIGAHRVPPDRAVALAGLLGLMVGALLMAFAFLRLGRLTQFISRPVALGYALGIILTVVGTELGTVLGTELERQRFAPAVAELWGKAGELSLVPAVFGLSLLLLHALLRLWAPPAVAPPVTLVVAALAVPLLGLVDRGVRVVDALPRAGLTLRVPPLGWADVWGLLPAAGVIAVFVFLDSTTTARSLAQREGYRVRPNHELFALGAMNAAAGLGGGFPVGGSTGDTELSESLRARTPLAGLVVVLLALAVLLFGPELPHLPFAALAVLAIGGVAGAFPFRLLSRAARFGRAELLLLLLATAGVLVLGPLRGMLLATLASMVHLVWLASHPRTEQLGALPDRPDAFVDLREHPAARAPPLVLVYRVDAALIYANIETVTEELLALTGDRAQPTRVVVLDLTAVNLIDVSAFLGLQQLAADLARRQIRLDAANIHGQAARDLRRFTRAARAPPWSDGFGQGDVRAAIDRAQRAGPPSPPAGAEPT